MHCYNQRPPHRRINTTNKTAIAWYISFIELQLNFNNRKFFSVNVWIFEKKQLKKLNEVFVTLTQIIRICLFPLVTVVNFEFVTQLKFLPTIE
jgi:hypothetical protein